MRPPDAPARPEAPSALTFRRPVPADAADIWRLVVDGGGLDENSPYAYVLVCTHWAATSSVAVDGDRVVGFVAGHRVPDDADALFVWQIGVHPDARGRGLAGRLLDDLVDADAPGWLEATVTPTNTASDALFRGFARRHGTTCTVSDWAPADWFPEGHEPEHRYRIGPLRP